MNNKKTVIRFFTIADQNTMTARALQRCGAFVRTGAAVIPPPLRLISAPPARKQFSLPPSISAPDFAECPPDRPHRCGLFRGRGG